MTVFVLIAQGKANFITDIQIEARFFIKENVSVNLYHAFVL